MSTDADIQHKETLIAPQGFDSEGADHALVPIVGPEVSATTQRDCSEADESSIREVTLHRLFSWLLKFGNSDDIGRAVLILARAIHHPGAPRTLEELGARFCKVERVGVGEARASQVVTALKAESDDFIGLFS